MKSVCIIGAGPAGLAATRTLLKTGQFEVTTYERNARIGGIWALDPDTIDGVLSPQTPTNLSRFTVAFSDLDWSSVDFSPTHDSVQNGTSEDRNAPPMFPKAWMVNRYLEEYRRRYIPDGVIHLQHEVVQAHRASGTWNITVKCPNETETTTRQFDYLILASGFFASPRLMKQDVPDLADVPQSPMIHSAKFRTLDTLFQNGIPSSGKTILLIGGGNSAGEAATAVAMQLSNAKWSPDQSNAAKYQNFKVVHVTPRPLYAMPPFFEMEEGSRSYQPLDLKFYDYARRPPDQPSYGGRQPLEVRNIVHGVIQTIIGGDQSEYSHALVPHHGEDRGCAYVALTEGYSEFVRSGLIEVKSGRVMQIARQENGCAIATVEKDNKTTEIHDIAAVVYATGFSPNSSIELLDTNTKNLLKYNGKSMRIPVILEQWQSYNREVPDLSLIGFYEGPYWGIIEMQARLTAQRWLANDLTSTNTKLFEEESTLQQLRQSMREKALDVPQYAFSDYAGYMEDLASELGLSRNDQAFSPREGCTTPARFISPGDKDHTEANKTMTDLHTIWNDCLHNGKYVARAAFRALQGTWKIRRQIRSAKPSFPSGVFEGTADFRPRYPTSPNPSSSSSSSTTTAQPPFEFEYLYIESGTFTTTTTNYSMPATRRYVYRYSESRDQISVWFLKPSNDLEVDYLFHNLDFISPEDARKEGACVARADHLCVQDMYWTTYRLPLKGVTLREFELVHVVKGPGKEYTATAVYERGASKGDFVEQCS